MTTISVTAEHIARGYPGDCRDCPVALAIKDAIPGLALVLVFPGTIDIRPRPDADRIEVKGDRGAARLHPRL